MTKKIFSFLICLGIVFSLAACNSKETAEPGNNESITAGISENASTAQTTSEATTEVIAPAETETTKAPKIYLDATDEDLNDLIAYFETIWMCNFLSRGFKRDSNALFYIMPAVKEYIYELYGYQYINVESGNNLPPRFHGIVYYNSNYSYQDAINANRKVIDPLFKFKDNYYHNYKWDEAVYFSIDADTVEWMAEELFGADIDRNNLIHDDETGISCYYCDGRYYFQDPGEHGGAGFKFELEVKNQDEEGKYILTLGEYGVDEDNNWIFKNKDKATVALIEKNGEKFWKFFEIDWNRSL